MTYEEISVTIFKEGDRSVQVHCCTLLLLLLVVVVMVHVQKRCQPRLSQKPYAFLLPSNVSCKIQPTHTPRNDVSQNHRDVPRCSL